MPFLRGTSFNDEPVRKAVIQFFEKKFNIILDQTPQELRLIDLTGKTETLLGVEVEGGGWQGCFWKNKNYSQISGLGFSTINIPIRKQKYWLQEYSYYGKIKQNPSYEQNVFVRTNKDFSQIIVIRPETIRNPNKLIRTQFKPNNSNELENWMSFRREDVETYNLQNGEWVLDQNYEI